MNLEESIKITVEGCDAILYDIVQVKDHNDNIYRVLVTQIGGINLDKCAEISRLISPILDLNEPMNGLYRLEVSSPGIERKLKFPQHFIASVGDKVKLKDLSVTKYRGVLLSANEDEIVLKTKSEEKTFSYDQILSASTYFEW
ncbi:MAG: ribosome maturation factor RimP [Campylobacterales bacterium]|nr:ribosome maturation factor RimP [Campylobacterales bacterium]NQY52388.1 ribosome maturation factor RimP [Campylobacteraceae bacterium]